MVLSHCHGAHPIFDLLRIDHVFGSCWYSQKTRFQNIQREPKA